VHASGRGGQFTYHGPGQRIAYAMLDLRRRTPDVASLVASLEEWIIRTLAAFGIAGERRECRIGVWVAPARQGRRPRGQDRRHRHPAPALGQLHGMALNVDPDLSHFAGIVPCGVADPRYGVTSIADLGRPASMAAIDRVLRREFEGLFGPTVDAQDIGARDAPIDPGRLPTDHHRPHGREAGIMFSELIKRVAVTLGALLVYWLGLHIPLPGVDATSWTAMFDMQSGGMLGRANALSGGGLRTLSILSLAVTPYISAAIVVQLLSKCRAACVCSGTAASAAASSRASHDLRNGLADGATSLRHRHRAGRPRTGRARARSRLPPHHRAHAHRGHAVLVWLAGQITARGIGNGIALIIAAGIVITLPREIYALIEGNRMGIFAPAPCR